MHIKDDSLPAKAYTFLQNNMYIAIYVMWFIMEMVLRCSTAELTYSLDPKYYIFAERYLKFALILYIICFQKYSWKEALVIIPVSVLLYFSARQAEFHELFYTWLFIIGAKNTSFDRIVKVSFILLAICISSFVILFKAGFLAEAGVMRGEQFRSALGFIHPNNFGARAFMLCACWMFIRRKGPGIIDYAALLLIACFVWIVPNSRTSALCIVILAGLIFINNHLIRQDKRRRKIYTAVLFIGALAANFGTVLLSIFYDSTSALLGKFDDILSGRLAVARGLYDESGISALGQRIYVTMSERRFAGLGETAINFDNSYMRILLHWGIIVYLLVCVFLVVTLIKKSREKDLSLFTVLVVVLVYSFSEKILYQAVYSIFILAGAEVIFGNSLIEKASAE